MKLYSFIFVMLIAFPSHTLAAGGEINGDIIQENSMKGIKIIGTKKIPVLPQRENVAGIKDYGATVNTVVNTGTIHGVVHQKNVMDSGTYINVEVNTLKNQGDVGTVIQKGIMTRSNIIEN